MHLETGQEKELHPAKHKSPSSINTLFTKTQIYKDWYPTGYPQTTAAIARHVGKLSNNRKINSTVVTTHVSKPGERRKYSE